MIASPNARKPLGLIPFAAIVLSFPALGLATLSVEAPHIRKWFDAREQAVTQTFTESDASQPVVAWARVNGLHVEVKTGLALTPAAVMFGVGTPDATCEVRLYQQDTNAFQSVTEQNEQGSQRAACLKALTSLAQHA